VLRPSGAGWGSEPRPPFHPFGAQWDGGLWNILRLVCAEARQERCSRKAWKLAHSRHDRAVGHRHRRPGCRDSIQHPQLTRLNGRDRAHALASPNRINRNLHFMASANALPQLQPPSELFADFAHACPSNCLN